MDGSRTRTKLDKRSRVQVQVQVISNRGDRVEVNNQEAGSLDYYFVVVEGLLKNLKSNGAPAVVSYPFGCIFCDLATFFGLYNCGGGSLVVGIFSILARIAHLISPMALPNKQVGPPSVTILMDHLQKIKFILL